MGEFRGKGMTAVAKEIAEGFLALNPIALKHFEADDYKALRFEIQKLQREARAEKFPFHDAAAVRQRNLRLQRLHGALVTLEHLAREKRIPLI